MTNNTQETDMDTNERRYEVGERVKLTHGSYMGDASYSGSVATVVEVGTTTCRLRMDDGALLWWADADFERVQS